MTPTVQSNYLENPDAAHLKRWQVLLLYSIFSVMLLLAVFAAVSGRAFFADGAYAITHFLSHPHEFWILDQPRAAAQYTMQLPVLIAEKLGLASAIAYSIAFSLGTFFVPIILYAIAAYTVRRNFKLLSLVIIAAVFQIYSINYIITELNLLCALVTLCAAVLSTYKTIGKLTIVLFIAASLAITRVHEGVLFSAPPLAIWAYTQLTPAQTAEHKTGLLLAILAFCYAFLIALVSGLAPRDPANASGFVHSFVGFFSSPQLYLGLCCAAAVLGIHCKNVASILFGILCIVLSTIFIIKVITLKGYYAYGVYYESRAFVSLATAGCVILLFIVSKVRTPSLSSTTPLAKWIFILLPILTIVASDGIGTIRWRTYVASFCTLLNDTSVSPKTAQTLEHENLVTGWSWNHPSLSVLLRKPGSSAVVLNYPTPTWQPDIPIKPGFPAWQRGLCSSQ